MLLGFFLLVLQVLPPPPPPSGSEIQNLQVTEWFGDPNKSTNRLGKFHVYPLLRLEKALGLVGPAKDIRDWVGYENIILGIDTGVIIITNSQEWELLVNFAANNGKDIDEICSLAESKGNYTAQGCPAAPIPIIWDLLLLASFIVLWNKDRNLADSTS